jgi:hypothetical protein
VFNGPKDKSFAIGGPNEYMIKTGDESKVIYLAKAVKLLRKEHLPMKMEWIDNGYTLGGRTLPNPTLWGTDSFDPDKDSDFGAVACVSTFQQASPTKKARKE